MNEQEESRLGTSLFYLSKGDIFSGIYTLVPTRADI